MGPVSGREASLRSVAARPGLRTQQRLGRVLALGIGRDAFLRSVAAGTSFCARWRLGRAARSAALGRPETVAVSGRLLYLMYPFRTPVLHFVLLLDQHFVPHWRDFLSRHACVYTSFLRTTLPPQRDALSGHFSISVRHAAGPLRPAQQAWVCAYRSLWLLFAAFCCLRIGRTCAVRSRQQLGRRLQRFAVPT